MQDWQRHALVCDELATIREDKEFLLDEDNIWNLVELASRPLLHIPSDISPKDWSHFFELADSDWHLKGFSSTQLRVLSALLSRPLSLLFSIKELGLLVPTASKTFAVHIIAAGPAERSISSLFFRVLCWFYPNVQFEIVLVGPELIESVPIQLGENMRVSFHAEMYHQFKKHHQFVLPNLIVGYNCGLLMYPSWRETLLQLLREDVPLVVTTYRQWEQNGEEKLLKHLKANIVLQPRENPFQSLAYRQSTTIVNDVFKDNSFVLAVTGRLPSKIPA